MHPPKQYKSALLLFLLPLLLACQKNITREADVIRYNDSLLVQNQIRVHTTIGACIGNSIIAGHPWRYSGLELEDLNYPDSFGQISWHLSQLTAFKWYDRGWGGQTTGDIRKRFLRDAIGDTSDPEDGIGPVSLPTHPTVAVVEGGINDIAANIPLDSIEANLAWMASTCNRNNIRCIMLNCVGSAFGFDSTQTLLIAALNDWLASGALDSVQTTVIDINSLWNSGAYGGISAFGNDNIHFSSLVDSVDGIHFTQAGYDSVAQVTFRVANLASIHPYVR